MSIIGNKGNNEVMTIVAERNVAGSESRTKRLKAATHDAHDKLDKFIMHADPFQDRKHYGRFLTMQHAVHRDVDALFFDRDMDALLPDLKGRRRLDLVLHDLADLDITLSEQPEPPAFAIGEPLPRAKALGWLYVIEGSNLGAAFLLKYAAALGMHESFGARHLAGAPEGRGLHWRTFTAALDNVTLTQEEEQLVVVEASAAFEHVLRIATSEFSQHR